MPRAFAVHTLEAGVETAKQNKQGQLPLKSQETEFPDGQMNFNRGQNEPETHGPRTNLDEATHGETSQQPGGLSSRLPQQGLTAPPPEKVLGEYQPEAEQEWVVSKGSAALRKFVTADSTFLPYHRFEWTLHGGKSGGRAYM